MNSKGQNNRKTLWWLGLIGLVVVLAFFLRGLGKSQKNPLLEFLYLPDATTEITENGQQTGGISNGNLQQLTLLQPDSTPLEETPLLLPGCVGSCCGHLKSLTALKDTELHLTHSPDSSVIAKLVSHQEFADAQSFILVRKYGEGQLANGQKCVVLADLKSGDVLIHDGKVRRAVSSAEVEILNPPVVESWVKILSEDGTEGWAQNPSLDWQSCK